MTAQQAVRFGLVNKIVASYDAEQHEWDFLWTNTDLNDYFDPQTGPV